MSRRESHVTQGSSKPKRKKVRQSSRPPKQTEMFAKNVAIKQATCLVFLYVFPFLCESYRVPQFSICTFLFKHSSEAVV